MAKKKTKKTPKRASRAAASATGDALRDAEKSNAARRAETAVELSVCWLGLHAKLDEIQVDAREYFKHGPRISEAEIDAELERHPKRYPHGRADVEWGLAHRDRLQLAGDLSRLWNRLPTIGVDKVGATGREAVADLLRALNAPGTGEGSFEPKRGFSDLVAEAMRVAQAVAGIDAELARAKRGSPQRAPSGVEIKVLQVLLASTRALTGLAISKKIGTNRRPVEDKAVWDAVARLRAECGFEIEKTAAGYWLADRDRTLARSYGISVEVVEVES
jgi:biotin operon repressor